MSAGDAEQAGDSVRAGEGRFSPVDVLVTSDSKFGSALLRRALTQLGHRVQDTGTAGAGTVLANQTWRADVVVAALVAGSSSRQRFGAVNIELGIALERGLPILLVAKSGLSLPFLAGIPRVDYADDEELLITQLDLLLQALREGSPREAASRTRMATSWPVPTTPASAMAHAMAVEARVGNLLQSHAGANAVIYANLELPDDVGEADFAIYFPKSAIDLGVVLVEVKATSPARPKLAARALLTDASRKLSQRVRASRSGLGLLVYEGETVSLPTTPMTIALSIDELERRLALEPLGQVLRQARNEAIHAL